MKNTTNGVDASLLVLLQSNKHEVIIQSLRASDEVTQKIIKESLPCYTVAGRFSMRSKAGLLELSGLANADLDSAEDYDIISLLQELKKIKSIAYAGLSCRGQRLHCIIPFLYLINTKSITSALFNPLMIWVCQWATTATNNFRNTFCFIQ
nr:hypothetical protein [Bacteroidota bacterium]